MLKEFREFLLRGNVVDLAVAVVLGGASTVGTVSLGYEHGLSGAALVFMIGLGLIGQLVVQLLAASGVRVVGVDPDPAKRYGVSARIVSAGIMAAYALMIAVTSTIASGTVFNSLLGVSTTVAILIAGGVVAAYCVTGGMWSLTLTDIIQFAIMTVGIFALLLPCAIGEAGGLGGMRDALPASYFEPAAIGWNTIFTYFLLFFFGLMIGQDIWQRIFTGRDEKGMRTGTIVAGLYCMVYGIAGALIGLLFLGIGSLFGLILGTIAGVFLGEYLKRTRQGQQGPGSTGSGWRRASHAAGGVLVGYLASAVI